MAECSDNDRTDRIGCGLSYSGELQHSVAVVPWSEWPDGRAHMTASLSVIDECWRKGTKGQMADPASLGFECDDNGRWRRPMDEETKTRLAEMRGGE